MTVVIGKKEISSNDILLSIITGLMAVILWFFYGVVGDVKDLAASFNKTNIENVISNADFNGKLDVIIQWTDLQQPKIESASKRSIENSTRLTILESVKSF
jgi:hypothetical protein